MTDQRGGAALRPGVTEAITQALFEELAGRGYAGTSMEAVSRRAGVGKAALYRRWASKEDMVLDIIGTTVRSALVVQPSTGRLVSDLRVVLEGIRTQLAHPLVVRIAPGLLAESVINAAFRNAVWTTVAEPRRAVVAEILRAAVDRGELPQDFNFDVGIDLLFAPLAFRMLAFNQPVEADYVDSLLIATIAALGAAREPGR
ncbi:TetR/AcrR family transcriptional regulator [Williamsia sp.]|uniref:TetR/AcrR family transcriptional regulator n=1 Tax=Williamsia sp. TaxID=1872085 RepID=UPI001A32C4E4|nr:TetR/AcrR family transcriptional regulator [Williamsia sp.]MBJ7289910.1 TetR/AcrR family transcriptional regulator [Williamsia sp.]